MPYLKNRFSIDGIANSRQCPAAMASIGLSFDESLVDERPRSLTSAVHGRLRAAILSTRLLPGQKLHIAGLSKQISVRLAAVREALSRLVADGLVQDVTQTRTDIEGLALRRSIERGDAAWLAAVEKSFAALCAVPYTYPDEPTHHYEEWVVRHRIFHRTLVGACGSPWLLGFRDVLHEQSERYRRLAIRRTTKKSRNVEAEHAAIVRATLKRDVEAAVAALSKHFATTMRLVELATPDTSGK